MNFIPNGRYDVRYFCGIQLVIQSRHRLLITISSKMQKFNNEILRNDANKYLTMQDDCGTICSESKFMEVQKMNTLDELVVSGAELDKELLSTLLFPFVRLDKDDSSVRPTSRWKDLNQQQQILLYLLARKAMRALPDFDLDEEVAAPILIGEMTGAGKSARGQLNSLLKKKLVNRTASGKYCVPNYALEAVKETIKSRLEGV